jgi:hypothetical protein
MSSIFLCPLEMLKVQCIPSTKSWNVTLNNDSVFSHVQDWLGSNEIGDSRWEVTLKSYWVAISTFRYLYFVFYHWKVLILWFRFEVQIHRDALNYDPSTFLAKKGVLVAVVLEAQIKRACRWCKTTHKQHHTFLLLSCLGAVVPACVSTKSKI